jgi:hypothetical protein
MITRLCMSSWFFGSSSLRENRNRLFIRQWIDPSHLFLFCTSSSNNNACTLILYESSSWSYIVLCYRPFDYSFRLVIMFSRDGAFVRACTICITRVVDTWCIFVLLNKLNIKYHYLFLESRPCYGPTNIRYVYFDYYFFDFSVHCTLLYCVYVSYCTYTLYVIY